MPTIADVDSLALRGLQDALLAALPPGASLEEASQTCASVLYDSFRSSLALARVFATVRLDELPPRERAAAVGAAGSVALLPDSPVLTLLGTRGDDAAWNDRARSAGHTAIPISSPGFVAGAPMITRLFRELGADVGSVDEDVQRVVERVVGGSLAGVFLVDDATTAKDQRGRLIIPAQDFVRSHGIVSVFGFGGSYVAGRLVVIILFAKVGVARGTADLFTRYVSSFKKATMRPVMSGHLFAGPPDRSRSHG